MAVNLLAIFDAKPIPERVRLVVSSLTDTRFLEQRLEQCGVALEHDTVSMASGDKREYFRELQQQYNWQKLPMVFADGEFIGGELELLRRLPAEHQLAPPSAAAWGLALSGLIPFFAMALWFATGALPFGLAFSPIFLWAYSAIILSFMAAIPWGAALAAPGARHQHRWYAASVVPSLAAWCAVGLFVANQPFAASVTVALGFIAVYCIDRLAVKAGLMPQWYLRLRTVLTTVVVAIMSSVAYLA